jgi:CheY-like chemotaxis protein
VLIVEDDAVNRFAAKRLVMHLGHEALTAMDGLEALEVLRMQAVDLILMDVQMPVMDGVEATRRIRNGEAGDTHRAIPIIAMTAYTMAGDRETFLASSMNDSLAKPVNVESLRSALLRAAATHRTQ